LIEGRSLQAIEFLQGLSHQFDRFGLRVRERGHGADRRFDGVDWRDVDNKECKVYADEHDKGELPKALQDMQKEGPHVRRQNSPAAPENSAAFWREGF
jgi:hypothetical protein